MAGSIGIRGGLGSLGGGTLGQVLVRVGIDTKQLDSGLTKAKTQSETAGSSISKFGAYAKAGFALAGLAAVKFVADSVQSYEEHQRVVAQLRLQVGAATQAFEDQATALQNLTGFQDEEVLSADTVLARFKLTKEEIQSTIPLVLDFARAQGQDVTTSAQQVGKALLGNTRALKAIGVDYTKTGNQALDLANIQDILRDKVGGAAEAFGKTFAGQVAILAAQFDDLKEQVGAAVIPLLTQLIPVLQDIVQGFSDGIDIVTNLGQRFPILGAAIRATFLPLQLLLDGLHELAEFMGGVEIQSAKMTGSLGGLKKTVRDSGVEFRTFGGLVGDALDEFRKSTITKFHEFSGAVGDLGKRWTITAQQAVQSMKRMAEMQRTLGEDLKQLDKAKIGTELKKFLLEQGPQAIHAFIDGTKRQRNDFQKAFELYRDSAKTVTDRIKEVTSTGGVAAGKALSQGVALGITGGASVAVNAAINLAQGVLQALYDKLEMASPSKKGMYVGRMLVEGLKIGIERAASEAVKAMQKLVDKFSEHLDGIRSRFASFKQSIAGGIAGFKDLASSVGGLFGQTDEAGNPIAVTGADISTNVAQQVADAQALAAALSQGATAGLNQNLLAQFASQGAGGTASLNAILADPALVKQLNDAYKTITQSAQTTAKSLGEEFFGRSLRRARDRMDELSDALRNLTRILRFLQNDTPNGAVGPAGIIHVHGDVYTQDGRQFTRAVQHAVQSGAGARSPA